LLVICCFSVATADDARGKITDYGITKLSNEQMIIKDPHSPTGERRVPNAANVLVITNRIPARIGVNFGIAYEISNLQLKDGETVEVVSAARFPVMTKPDGTTSNGYDGIVKLRVQDRRAAGSTGYSFEHDYELVPGSWEFEIRFQGRTLCKQEFTVFLE
jgi:hypothetical protein